MIPRFAPLLPELILSIGATVLMMAAAFGGYDLVMEAYKVAKKEKHKFLTYGDAMLIL